MTSSTEENESQLYNKLKIWGLLLSDDIKEGETVPTYIKRRSHSIESHYLQL